MGLAVRYDRALIEPNWEETPEGYLRISATFARTGLQRYRRQDGSEAVEYRPEEEVSKEDSLLSLANLPVTLEHPPELLTPETCREYQRGHTGSNIEYRTPFAYGVVTITDSDAIKAVKNGEAREVSVGYRVKFDATPGITPDGERYDGVQREISGNHVAIVRKGRAGPDVRLHMDAACAIDPFDQPAGNYSTTQQEESMTAVAALSNATEALANALSAQVRADAKGKVMPPSTEEDFVEEMEEGEEEDWSEEEEMEEEEMDGGGASNLGSWKASKKDTMASSPMKGGKLSKPMAMKDGMVSKSMKDGMVSKSMYDRACNDRDDAIAAHEHDLGRLDALMERLDSLETELDARLDSGPDLDELVKQRIELIDNATAILGARPTFDGLSDRELMLDTLVEAGVDPVRLENKSDDYIAATFDAMAAGGLGRADSDPLADALGSIPTSYGGLDAARQRMIGRQKNAWQQPLTKTKGA